MAITSVVVAGIAGVFATVLWERRDGAPERTLICRILPNQVVPALHNWRRECPLRAYDRVIAHRTESGVHHGRLLEGIREALAAPREGVSLLVARGGEEQWVWVPATAVASGRWLGRLAAGALLSTVLGATALLILWGSSASAAAPIAYFYTCVAVFFLATIGGGRSEGAAIAGVVATGAIPVTLAHLALTFPRDREVVRASPLVLRVVYGLGALLVGIGVVNFERSPAVWTLADRLMNALAVVAWAFLTLECVLAVRESSSVLERSRAKVLLGGAVAIPTAPLVAGALLGEASPVGSIALLTVTVALLPLPVGFAIANYRLFDVGLAMRRAVAYVLYVGIAAALVCAATVLAAVALGESVPFGDAWLLYSLVFVGLLLGEPVRARLWAAIDGLLAPWFERLRVRSEQYARKIAELRDPDDCARILCQAIREGLDPSSVAVFLRSGPGWRLAAAAGVPTVMRLDLADLAPAVAGDAEVVYLPEAQEGIEVARQQLEEAGVETLAVLRCGNEISGLALIAGSRRNVPFSSIQMDYLRSVSRQAALAVHNAFVARGLLEAERSATLGRIEAGLLHDLGKPLGVLEHLAGRLPDRIAHGDRVHRDAGTIARLARDVRIELRSILSKRRKEIEWLASRERRSLESVLADAVSISSRQHGEGRVCVRLAPGLPDVARADDLVRVVTNLLDNALLASGPEEVVDLVASSEDGRVHIEVTDRGAGMSRWVAGRAFEPFFSTRPRDEGSGLGLTVCRDLVAELGGRIRLDSRPGAGTRVEVELPAPDGGNVCAEVRSA